MAAQDAPPLRLTLEEAQARALAASHRIAEMRARESTAQGSVAIREASARPLLSAQAGYTRTNHVVEFTVPGPTGVPRTLYPDVPDNYRTRLDLQWPIYTGGRTDALERAARAEAAAVTAEVGITQADLRLEVARTFWALVTANATVNVIAEGVSRAQAHLAAARVRVGAGTAPSNEVSSAEAQESRQRMLLIEARNQREMTMADLARLTGVAIGQPIDPVATLDAPAASQPGMDALVAEARGQRGERQAMERRIEGANELRVAAAAGNRPVVAIGAGFDYARPNPKIFPRAAMWDDSWDAAINVSWPLWDGGRVRADIAQAGGAAEAARQRLAEFDSILALEIRQRLLELDSGQAAIAAAEDSIRAATDARRVVTERYQAGVAQNTEVLDANFALLQAELDRTRAQAAVRLAEARLARALGR
jgi:outer membrane protein TolC